MNSESPNSNWDRLGAILQQHCWDYPAETVEIVKSIAGQVGAVDVISQYYFIRTGFSSAQWKEILKSGRYQRKQAGQYLVSCIENYKTYREIRLKTLDLPTKTVRNQNVNGRELIVDLSHLVEERQKKAVLENSKSENK